ncbi:MAG: 50S ribosomal protein L10 [Candidatus Thermoplasmatota archaeon]
MELTVAHVAEWKYDEVKQLEETLQSKKVVGIVNIGGIPAPQMQQIRKNFQEDAIMRCSKNTLISIALDKTDGEVKGITDLKDSIQGQTAIVATDMNSFKLFSKVKNTRTMAPAKGGETAPEDIEVKKGDTPFKPGPIVGDLQKVGIPAAIQEGKVVIKKDKILVKKGETITRDVAQMLTRLEIYPIEIGINLQATFEDGTVFKPEILDIDIDQFRNDITQAASYALNLAIDTGWANPQTIRPLLMKAYRDAFSVALEASVTNEETIKHLISKAYAQMQSLKNKTS